jgi:hypothetical protein
MRFERMRILMFIISFIPYQIFATENKKESIDIKTTNNHFNSIKKIHIHPNPTSEYIQIQSVDQYHIELVDMDGKKIKEAYRTSRLYVTDVKDGLYLINFKDSNGNSSQQIITIIH